MVKHSVPTKLGYAEDQDVGVVIEVLPATDAKAWKKVRVLTEKGLEDWIIQFCEVINESR
tara:strand:+ start:470 stop:649 length:180 start_codon:yes stop_codon:yes gene_type:complete